MTEVKVYGMESLDRPIPLVLVDHEDQRWQTYLPKGVPIGEWFSMDFSTPDNPVFYSWETRSKHWWKRLLKKPDTHTRRTSWVVSARSGPAYHE